jgi:hypothetical protein
MSAASIQLLSDDRHADVSAFAGAQDGSTSDSDSQSASPFADFHKNLHVAADWLDTTPGPGGVPEHVGCDATATQDSTLSALQLFFHSEIEVTAGGNGAGTFGSVDADALSFFQVSFSVSSPIIFNLSFFDARGYIVAEGATYEKAFDLTSDSSGSILTLPIIMGDTAFYTGLLSPGQTYTLLVSQHAHTSEPDPFGSGVHNTLEVNMNVSDVPEPSIFLSLLVGLALLGIARAKFSSLFCTQSAHRIDLRGASRRQPRRH